MAVEVRTLVAEPERDGNWWVRAPDRDGFKVVAASYCTETHAKLFAAAPDLLDALKSLKSFLNGFEDDDLQVGVVDMLTTARAAIARAEGRS